MTLALLPLPKKLRYGAGSFRLPASGSIGITDGALEPVARQAAGLFKRATVQISIPQAADALTLRLVRCRNAEQYRLSVSRRGLAIEGGSPVAVFWGLQTLRQILEQCPGRRLPALTITDWPDFADRALYYDICRGRVPKLERLMELADQLACYKMNQLQLYIEHTFAFRGHPDIGRGASPLSADDILRLDAYCRERHVELVPSLASFGHLAPVLNLPRYRRLAENWGIGKYLDPKTPENVRNMKQAFTLSPANPEVYRFLDSLFAEFLPLFSSKRFNACCDETWDLGYGQSYPLCKRIGKGRLYLGHIVKLNEICKKYGKRMMFWGDIIRHYPDLIPQIPRDVAVLDWGYDHNHPFERIRDFKKAGLEFLACPSVSGYFTLFPRLPQAMANIAGFAAAARRHGARGVLNTDWGDGGHYNLL
jgi:N-acetyl-beta-hexosaminidase